MKQAIRILIPVCLVAFTFIAAYGQQTNLLPNGGFESGKPSLFTAEPGTSGATLTWATDQTYVGSPHSLKIVKPATGSVARWVSSNMVRYWVDKIGRNVDIKLGAYVKTSGVNTNPANDQARWQLKFFFYDTLGAPIGGGPFVLNVDQTIATRDWYADTNGVGTVNLPVDAYRMTVSAEGGTNATGTVWVDNFIHVGRANQWAGQNWNGFVEADSGWQYWISPNGGNDGVTDFPGSGVTTATAHSGSSSLKINAPVGRASGELIFFTETVSIPANSAGKKYVLSAWVKTSTIKKDSVFNASCALGFTWTWHTKLFADAGNWNEVGSGEYRFVLKDTSQDWTQYQVIITVPDNTVRAVSVRPRAYPLFTGIGYYDDFSVNALDQVVTSVPGSGPTPLGSVVPADYKLSQNFPNPFNPTTSINYDLPKSSVVKIEIYNIVGQRMKTLVNELQAAGKWSVQWNGNDDAGVHVASGIYFYRLETPNAVLTQKMVLLK